MAMKIEAQSSAPMGKKIILSLGWDYFSFTENSAFRCFTTGSDAQAFVVSVNLMTGGYRHGVPSS
jgi:hypothetical protein